MTKAAGLSARQVARALEHFGARHIRTTGDHMIYVKPGLARPLVVPLYKSLPTFIVLNLIRTLGVDRDEFLRVARG